MSSELSLNSLFQVNMPVRDFERALPFYRDVLGLPLHAQREGLAFFSAGTVRVLLERVEEETGRFAHPGSVLYFPVPDMEKAHDELTARGVEFVERPSVVSSNGSGDTWMAFFSDGDWNTHALVTVVARATS